jgi:hypothetical protein
VEELQAACRALTQERERVEKRVLKLGEANLVLMSERDTALLHRDDALTALADLTQVSRTKPLTQTPDLNPGPQPRVPKPEPLT